MNYNKIIGFVFLFLFSLSSVNALDINSSTTTLWRMDDLTNDIDVSESILTNIGTATLLASANCYTDECYEYDGTNDYMSTPVTINTEFTVSLWFKNDVASARKAQLGIGDGNRLLYVETQNSGDLAVFLQSSAGNHIYDTTIPLSSTSWTHLVVTSDGSTLNTYVDGVSSIGSRVTGGTLAWTTFNNTAYIGVREDTTSQRYDGRIDEIVIFDLELDAGEALELYNNGINVSSTVPSLSIDNITLINNTFSNSTSLDIGLNISQLNSNTNINTTLYLSNGSSYQIGTHTQNVSYTLKDIQTGEYNFWTFSYTNDTNITSNNFTYEFNPQQYFYFLDDIRIINVYNFTLNGLDFVDVGSLSYRNFSEGTNTIVFSKIGYVSKSINFSINLSNPLNQTFNVTPSNVFFTVYDFADLSQITAWNLTIKQGSTIINESTENSTYQLFYNSSLEGELEFIFQKAGYIPSHYFIDFQSGSTATENIYLLNNTANTLMPITVKNILATSHIEGASVNLYGIKENQEYFIDEQITDHAGKVYFTLHDDFLYKLIIVKNGYVTTNYKISPTESSYTFLIPEDSTNLEYVFAGFSYLLDIFNSTFLRVQYTDEDSLINKVTLNLETIDYSSTNFSLISNSDTLLLSLPENATYYNAHLEVIRNNITYNFYKSFNNQSFIEDNTPSIKAVTYVPDQEDKTIITLFVIFGSLMAGFLFFGIVGGYIGVFISTITLWYVGLLSIFIAMPVLLFVLLMFGFFRGGDF